MNIKRTYDGEITKNENGIKAQRVYDKPDAQAVHITLEAGARLDTHTTKVDVFFYILEGTAWVEVGDEGVLVEKDNIVESPKGIPHALENKSDSGRARVLVVKTPKP